jgi:hypothetical protein
VSLSSLNNRIDTWSTDNAARSLFLLKDFVTAGWVMENDGYSHFERIQDRITKGQEYVIATSRFALRHVIVDAPS